MGLGVTRPGVVVSCLVFNISSLLLPRSIALTALPKPQMLDTLLCITVVTGLHVDLGLAPHSIMFGVCAPAQDPEPIASELVHFSLDHHKTLTDMCSPLP
jgi:hypothetical protein